MGILAGIEPRDVFYYFEEIATIPHGSYHTKQISDYCVTFAKAHGLKVLQDEVNNIIIIKEASKGYEEVPAVILQGHLDMVCEKEADVDFDFLTDGLRLEIDGDYISAKGTTLGADDGIAIAYALALLSDDTLMHPRLEVVFTVDEEVGMEGANKIDLSMLTGKYMLNLDSEEEGIFLASCAGGVRGKIEFPVEYTQETKTKYTLEVKGLLGGHSGGEIHRYRANANKLLGRIFYTIGKEVNFDIISLEGGKKDNAIPREASAEIFIEESDCEQLEKLLTRLEQILKKEYASNDPDVTIAFTKDGVCTDFMLTPKSREILIFYLMHVPNGVQKMSADIEGLVQTSLNLGILTLTEKSFILEFAIRSSVESEKEMVCDQLEHMAEFFGAEYTEHGDYPSWPYQKESRLRALLLDCYKKQYHKEGAVQAIHAGLECGILLDKIPGLDAVALGPDIYNAHTPQEKLSISSTARYYEFLREVLKRFIELEK